MVTTRHPSQRQRTRRVDPPLDQHVERGSPPLRVAQDRRRDLRQSRPILSTNLRIGTLVDTLYRGLADNSVGRVIETILRAEYIILDDLGFAPLDHTGAQLLFRFVAAAYERRSLGVASHWPFEEWGRFLPEHTTAGSMLDRLLHHAHVVVTQGDSYRMKEARARGGPRRRPNP